MASGWKTALAKSRAGVIATRKSLAQDRVGDFNTTSDIIAGIGGNLSTTLAGTGRTLTKQNSRQLAALAKLAGKTNRGNASVIQSGRASAENQFGAAAGLAAPGFAQASGHAAGEKARMKGVVGAGKTVGQGAQALLGILDAGAATAQAGAVAQTADALLYRAKDDARLIADQQNLVLQAELAFQNWKRQQDYTSKLETSDPTKYGGASVIANTAEAASAWIRKWLASEEGLGQSPASALAAYVAANGTLGDAETVLVTQIARAVHGSVDPETGLTRGEGAAARESEAQSILNAILINYPDMPPKQQAALLKQIRAGLEAQYASVMASSAAAAPPSGGTAGFGGVKNIGFLNGPGSGPKL